MPLPFVVIVEGKNDRHRLQQILSPAVPIYATYGIPGTERLEKLKKEAGHRQVVILTDQDAAGQRIRRMLREVFPDAINIYTKRSYNGVEHTPVDFLAERFRRVGLIP